MEGKVWKSYLLNDESAADVVVANGLTKVTGLIPVPTIDIIGSYEQVAVVEVQQIVTVGVTPNTPTITAATKYQIKIGNTFNRRDGAQSQLAPYGYTSPAVLTGNAASDRHNAYTSIAGKINSQSENNFVEAGAMISATHSAGVFIVGAYLTDTTSGATGIVVADAANTITIAVLGGVFSNGDTITDGTNTETLTSNPTVGLGLYIRDLPGYFAAYNKGFRRGPSTIIATAGFTPAMVVVATAGVVSYGQGARLLQDVPIHELTSSNLAQGLYSFPTAESPVVGDEYTSFTLLSRSLVAGNMSASSSTFSSQIVYQVVYANEGAAGFGAFRTALQASFPQL